MKKTGYKILIVLLLLVTFAVPTHALDSNDFDNEPVYGKNFDIQMNVKENGLVNVNVTLDMMFNAQRQGIFVSLPKEYTNFNFSSFTGNKSDDGKTYYFPISNFTSSTHEFKEEDSNSAGAVYRMGTQGVYLEGLQTFKYSYDIQTRDLDLSTDDQLFLMNILGTGWEFPFENLTYGIHFEKDIGDVEVKVQASNSNELLPFEINGNDITGSYSGPNSDSIPRRHGLTILVDVEDNYFAFKNFDYSWFLLGASGLLVALIMMMKIRYSHKQPIIDSIEFTAPDGLNSAEVGYIYDDVASDKDIVSLIIYWASKGYLAIIEHENDEIELKKLKDMDKGAPEAISMFKDLFKNRESVTTDDLKNSFYTTINRTSLSMSSRFVRNDDLRLYDKKSVTIQGLAVLLMGLLGGAFGFVAVYNKFAVLEFGFFAFMIAIIASVFIVALGATVYDKASKIPEGKFVNYVATSFGAILMGVVFLLVGAMMKLNMTAIYAFIGVMIVGYFATISMKQRSAKGARWYGQVLGLRKFIKTAEVERLEMFVQETPYIFYDILPYAYVLGLSDTWSKKFETIAMETPDWYQSTSMMPVNPYLLSRTLTQSISSSMTSFPPAKGSSGGGFSSGGGGGGSFGGGGFGGGGGGSW